MAMNKLKISDMVVVLAGKDKSKSGKIIKIMGDRALVENVNIVKKHVKPNPQANQQGGILEREAPIHISNIAIVNPVTGKADRVGFKILEDGKKVRYFKSNDEIIDI